jgi:voltage-gated potassium channel Kch
MLGLLWSLAYRLVDTLTPGAFAFNATHEQSMADFSAFYFSFVTLTTVGYGDITPVSSVARMLAVMESMTGTLYVAVLIARLVALYSVPEPLTRNDNPDQPPS